MKTYEVELRRTSYVTVTVTAKSEDEAEEKAWAELESGTVDEQHESARWELESVMGVPDEI